MRFRSDEPTPAEFFNFALDEFARGELEEAVAHLRCGFFANLYIAPVLIGEEYEAKSIWYPDRESAPDAAEEYARRYGGGWEEQGEALLFLGDVWRDSLVRSEIRSFLNLSKAIEHARAPTQREELLAEWSRFADERRIRRTQGDILSRLRGREYRMPLSRPRLALVLLAARDVPASTNFYRSLLGIEPMTTSRLSGGFAEFELPGVRIAIHGRDRLAEGDPYGLGAPPESLGWGAIFVLRVDEYDRYRESAAAAHIGAVDEGRAADGRRFFVVRDPSGYLIEISEERDPSGFSALY